MDRMTIIAVVHAEASTVQVRVAQAGDVLRA
jgi:hypothetical protein